MQELGEKYSLEEDQLLLTWLLQHPAEIYPVVGTPLAKESKGHRSHKTYFRHTRLVLLYEASNGHQVANYGKNNIDYRSHQWHRKSHCGNFSQRGARLILCGRREERLKTLQKELDTPCHTLCFDVRDRQGVFSAIESLPSEWKTIDVLVNNAGNAHGLDPVEKASLDDWDAMIDSNVKGLMYVTKAVLPQMVERKRGHIINLGSIAG